MDTDAKVSLAGIAVGAVGSVAGVWRHLTGKVNRLETRVSVIEAVDGAREKRLENIEKGVQMLVDHAMKGSSS